MVLNGWGAGSFRDMGMVTDGESELDGIQDKINEEILQMMDEERSLICIK